MQSEPTDVQTNSFGTFWVTMGFLTFLFLFALLDPDLQTLICGLLRTE